MSNQQHLECYRSEADNTLADWLWVAKNGHAPSTEAWPLHRREQHSPQADVGSHPVILTLLLPPIPPMFGDSILLLLYVAKAVCC